jgi:hypothetical protein
MDLHTLDVAVQGLIALAPTAGILSLVLIGLAIVVAPTRHGHRGRAPHR